VLNGPAAWTSHRVMVTKAMLALALVLAVGAWAAAGTVDHVRVNGAGRNSTRTFSTTLSVDVALVSGYRRVSFDGDEGNWDGPGYHASLKPSSTGATHMGWGVAFDLASRFSLEKFAKHFALDFGSWRVLQEGKRAIPHMVGGRQVGTIKGLMLLTQAPGDNAAAFDSAVAFPLCKGVIVAAHFSTLSPGTNTAGPLGNYVVDDGTDVQAWNRDHISTALDGVVVNGYLPAGRLTATARRRAVQGIVSDCIGHPMPAVAVKVGKSRALTSASGRYKVHVAGPGSYVVTVSAGGGTLKRTVRIR
jgi:hypothetical protein